MDLIPVGPLTHGDGNPSFFKVILLSRDADLDPPLRLIHLLNQPVTREALQQPRVVESDARRWRGLTGDLTPERYDKVTKLFDEIERQLR